MAEWDWCLYEGGVVRQLYSNDVNAPVGFF